MIQYPVTEFCAYRIKFLPQGKFAHTSEKVKNYKKAEIKLYSLTKSNKIRTCKNTNKASGGDGTPVELFQILKDDALKVLHSICQQI